MAGVSFVSCIIVDAANKTLTIQSTAAKQDFVYDLTEDEVKKLTNNSIKQVPVQNRIDIINNAIRNDFQDKLTMDMLNSKEQISLKLRPEIEAELNNRQQMVIDQSLPSNGDQITIEPEDRSVAHVDGNSYMSRTKARDGSVKASMAERFRLMTSRLSQCVMSREKSRRMRKATPNFA